MRPIHTLPVALLLLAGCTARAPANESEQAVITDATDNFGETVREADARADRLDELAGGLDAAANRAGGDRASALRDESAADLADAAAARADARRNAAAAEEALENRAGLINQR